MTNISENMEHADETEVVDAPTICETLEEWSNTESVSRRGQTIKDRQTELNEKAKKEGYKNFPHAIMEMAKKGHGKTSIYGWIGGSWEWIDKQVEMFPKLDELLKEAESEYKKYWYNIDIHNLYTDKDSNTQLNTKLWQFSMKNRMGWSDRTDMTSNGESMNINVVNYKDAD